MKKKLNILGELIAELQGVKSKEFLVRKMASFMYREFRSASVEISWGIGATTKVYSSTRQDNEFDLRVTDRDINQSAFSEVLSNGQALVSEVQDEIDADLFMEERKAVELFASQLVILPLYEGDDINGFLSFYLLEEHDLAGLSELFQHILNLTTLMLKQCDLNNQLTKISRKGFKLYRQMRENLEDVIYKGEAEAAGYERQKVLRESRLASQCSTPVYITGEEGTDKEEVARYIHRLRTHDKEPMLIFDCANVPVNKQTELLFGTVVSSDKPGYLDKALSGSLYIINADQMIPECQEALMEVLETGAEEKVQIMISGELEKAEMAGDFDSELLDMVSEMNIEVPPLRDCREDLAIISKKYCKELASKLKLPVPKMGRKFLHALLAAEWKGNHKELKAFLERSMICSPGKDLMIPEGFAEQGGIPVVRTAESLKESIKRNIVDALKKTRGKVYGDDGAAVLLGLNPSTLQSKMRKLGIKKKSYKMV